MIDDKKGHLYLGEEKFDLRLLLLRPIDLIEFCEFAGANADDILIWVGKTLGKYWMEKIPEFEEKDWSSESMHEKKEALLLLFPVLESLGYGVLQLMCKKSELYISVQEPISESEKENIMAKSICLVYQGMFSGILEKIEIDADGEEVNCYLKDGDACVFKYEMLIEEFDDEDIDEEKSEEGISGFLSSL